jgi:hypothetical protein
MAFTLIQGKYVVGFAPDGDSVRFIPDNAAVPLALRGPKPDGFKHGAHRTGDNLRRNRRFCTDQRRPLTLQHLTRRSSL